jgi:Outer membrane protein beta-barrel domain
MKLFKIFLLAVVVLATSNTVSAQKWGVNAGVNISTLTGGDFDNISTRSGFYVGAFREMKLVSKILFLQPELQYSSQGFTSEQNGIETDNSIDYLNVPVLARVYFLKLFSFDAGPQFGFKVGDNFKGETSDSIESFDFAGAFGFNINLPLGLSINTRYILGFTEVIQETDLTTSVFQVGASFKF